jgi:hypothetical protein
MDPDAVPGLFKRPGQCLVEIGDTASKRKSGTDQGDVHGDGRFVGTWRLPGFRNVQG